MHDRQGGAAQARLAREQGLERAVAMRQLLAAEEDEAEVHRGVRRRAVERQLDHHRERALHVGGAEAVHRALADPAGPVVLCRHGVEMAGEQHERALARGADARHDAGVARVTDGHARLLEDGEHMLGEPLLGARLRPDVDELERARGEALGERVGHGRDRSGTTDTSRATGLSARRRPWWP